MPRRYTLTHEKWQHRVRDEKSAFFDSKRPPKDRCCICSSRLEQGEGITETRRTGVRLSPQTWRYCRRCAPRPARVTSGRRIG
jgi:hypothetical protein